MNVGELESVLFDIFPSADAESWDMPGLCAGDRSAEIIKIACNLDPTVQAVISAQEAGCNVLLTHHPVFIGSGPIEFGPFTQAETPEPGRVIYEAIKRGVNLIAMHTNVDRSLLLREEYERLFSLCSEGNFEHFQKESLDAYDKGFGVVFTLDQPLLLLSFAQEVSRIFTSTPRVWGNDEMYIHRFALLNGSWNDSDLYNICQNEAVDCLIVGETRYHNCLDMQPYVSLIDLGHDISELPIVSVLINALKAKGISSEQIINLQLAQKNWRLVKGE